MFCNEILELCNQNNLLIKRRSNYSDIIWPKMSQRKRKIFTRHLFPHEVLQDGVDLVEGDVDVVSSFRASQDDFSGTEN